MIYITVQYIVIFPSQGLWSPSPPLHLWQITMVTLWRF